MKKETIIRVSVLIIALINQILCSIGVIDFMLDQTELYESISLIITTLASLWAMWKNNSFTKNAQKADEYLKELKRK